jgi:COPII coat assembly protein SEC16
MMQFYADTVKKMAHCHFEPGSPLRTLCLLIAGQPAGVFNFENPADSGSLHTAQPPVEVIYKYHCSVVLNTPIYVSTKHQILLV